jgi:hypothetical protein
MPVRRRHREDCGDRWTRSGSRQAKPRGGARAPRVWTHPLSARERATMAARTRVAFARTSVFIDRQARSIPPPSSGTVLPATGRLRHSISARADEVFAAFCVPYRSTFDGALATAGADSVDINNKRQVKEEQRRRKARQTGRCCCPNAAKRPASLVCRLS